MDGLANDGSSGCCMAYYFTNMTRISLMVVGAPTSECLMIEDCAVLGMIWLK